MEVQWGRGWGWSKSVGGRGCQALTIWRCAALQAPRTGRTTSAFGATGQLENMYEHALGEAQAGGVDLRGAPFT